MRGFRCGPAAVSSGGQAGHVNVAGGRAGRTGCGSYLGRPSGREPRSGSATPDRDAFGRFHPALARSLAPSPSVRRHPAAAKLEKPMFRFLGSVVGIIFMIGLAVVIGLLVLIF